MKKERKQWIDFLRGVAMLLVIWGHISRNSLFFVVTSPVKIPLFFAITGYVFNDEQGHLARFAKKQWKTIVIPWIVLSLIWLKAGYLIASGNARLVPKSLYDFISGNTYWFMPCILVSNAIHFLIRKNRNYYCRYLLMTGAGVVGLLIADRGIGRFAMFNVACVSQLFMMFGYWFRGNESKITAHCKPYILVALGILYGVLIGISIHYFPGEAMDVHNNIYYSYSICGAMIFTGLTVLFTVFCRINNFPKWVTFVGQNTLAFYILHYYVRRVIKKACSLTGLSLPNSLQSNLIEFALVCVVLTLIAYMLNTWLPEAVGKKNRTVKR